MRSGNLLSASSRSPDIWSVISGGEGFAVGGGEGQDGRPWCCCVRATQTDWHISACSQIPSGCSSYQRKEASGHRTPLLGCNTGSRDSEGNKHTHIYTCSPIYVCIRKHKNTNAHTQLQHRPDTEWLLLHLAGDWRSWMEQRCLTDYSLLLTTDPPIPQRLTLTAWTEKHLLELDADTRLKHCVWWKRRTGADYKSEMMACVMMWWRSCDMTMKRFINRCIIIHYIILSLFTPLCYSTLNQHYQSWKTSNMIFVTH